MKVWLTVLAVSASTVLLKGLGPLVLGGRALPAAAARLLPGLGPALLAGLVATSAFTTGGALTIDARAAGLAVAAAAILLRAPVLLVVIAAAAATAVTRFLLGG
jgi:branched-subunit amino acid transport protein